MAINTNREWRRGEDTADLAEYLEEYAAGGYQVHRTCQAICAGCEGRVFRLRADPEEGAVERICVGCGRPVLMLDSADYLEDAEPEDVICPCGADAFDVMAGFSLLDNEEVRWVSVGVKYEADGTLACCADWKIDSEPSRHLPERV